ncbi:MAG: Uma2 family endonuclease [Polyangiaceae bacterium]|nr:Uma2 family endonuclease [Polyangiaceae bacterium]
MSYADRVTAAAPRLPTYADLCALPPNVVGQIVAGELHAHPRPRLRHARAASDLGASLVGPFDRGRGGPGGWIILDEPEVHLDADVLVPDLAGWRRSRMPELPDAAFVELAPDWVCEVLSPSSERLDRGAKLRVYARERVGHVWLVNPDNETLEVFVLDEHEGHEARFALAAVHSGDAVVHAPPFEALPLELSGLWAR